MCSECLSDNTHLVAVSSTDWTLIIIIIIIKIIIIIIIQKFITHTCSQALSLNRRCGQSLGGWTECVNCL